MMVIVAPVSQKTVMSAPGPRLVMILLVGVKVQPAQAAVCGRPCPTRADTKKPDTALSSELSLWAGAAVLLCQLLTTSNIFENLFSSQFMELISLLSHIPFQLHKPDLVKKTLRFLLLSIHIYKCQYSKIQCI